MRKIKILLVVASAVLLVVTEARAQRETRVEQRYSYSEDERNDPKDYLPGNVDWAVYFKYPSNVNRVVVNSRGETERAVLSRSDINENYIYRNERYVKVLTGWRARKYANYQGNRQAWANSLRLVYYMPFQPRGPVQPRGPERPRRP